MIQLARLVLGADVSHTNPLGSWNTLVFVDTDSPYPEAATRKGHPQFVTRFLSGYPVGREFINQAFDVAEKHFKSGDGVAPGPDYPSADAVSDAARKKQ